MGEKEEEKKDMSDPSLSDKDAQLWKRVRHTVARLSDRPGSGKEATKESNHLGDRDRPGSVPEPSLGALRKTPAPAEGLERRLSRRIASGRVEIQSTIDLHGLNRNEAHATLIRHIEKARRRGEKRVLVITGKGRDSSYDPLSREPPGVLRRLLPDWLRGQDLAPHVVAFEAARQRHGGSGAFYIQLRGKRHG